MSRTYHLGLAGWPLIHSLSPSLHNAALRACHLSGEYELFRIPPLPSGEGQLANLLRRLRVDDLQGLNITIPHKLDVLPFLEELTPAARAVGAVNTVLRDDSRLVGDNTDVIGFWEDLAPRLPVNDRQAALVLGAGGAARSVVYSLSSHGWRVYILARRPEQARELASDFASLSPSPIPSGMPMDDSAAWLRNLEVGLVVNASPLGMFPNERTSPWPADVPLPEGSFIYDLVYEPPETVLLQRAESQGLQVNNGLGMLVNQAARAFIVWTELPVEDLSMIKAAMHEVSKPKKGEI